METDQVRDIAGIHAMKSFKNNKNFNSTLCLTGSQCKDASTE